MEMARKELNGIVRVGEKSGSPRWGEWGTRVGLIFGS